MGEPGRLGSFTLSRDRTQAAMSRYHSQILFQGESVAG
jgi:hypothetical protein